MNVPKYRVYLDAEPKKRWKHIILKYKQECLDIVRKMEATISSFFMGPTLLAICTRVAKYYKDNDKVMYKDEIEGIAEILGISTEKVILGQLCYEFFSACTSIVMKVKGLNVHYRTMDWDLPDLKKVTIDLEFIKEGKVVFKGISWAGYIGIMTGKIPKKYSVALNYRRSNGNLLGNATRATSMCWPIGYLIRSTLEKEYDFNIALKAFSRTYLISPCYITMCNSSGHSYIITRDCDKCLSKLKSDNFLIQTNVDYDKDEPNILYSIERRGEAQRIIMEQRDSWNNYDDVMGAFRRWPIINEETIYVCLLDPQNSNIISYVVE